MDWFICNQGVVGWISPFISQGWWDGLVHLIKKGCWDGLVHL